MKNIVAMSSANIENIRKGKFFRFLESDRDDMSERGEISPVKLCILTWKITRMKELTDKWVRNGCSRYT